MEYTNALKKGAVVTLRNGCQFETVSSDGIQYNCLCVKSTLKRKYREGERYRMSVFALSLMKVASIT